jgi:hypothetical protein
MARERDEEVLHPPQVEWRGDRLAPDRKVQIDAVLLGAIARAAAGAEAVEAGGLGLAGAANAPTPTSAASAAAGGTQRLYPVTLVPRRSPKAGWSPKTRQFVEWMELPDELLRHEFVRDILDEWDRTTVTADFNPLLIDYWVSRFYKEFCLRIARRMLTRSRQRMVDQVGQLSADRERSGQRLSRVIDWLARSAERLRSIRSGRVPTIVDRGPPAGGTILPDEPQSRRQPSQQLPGSPSGGTILADEPPGEPPATPAEVAGLQARFTLARELEPLLVVLSIEEGRERALEDVVFGLTEAAPADVLQRVLDGLAVLQRETIRAEQVTTADLAVGLAFVRQEANVELDAWLKSRRWIAEAVERAAGGGIPISATLGLAAFVLMFVFPPAGLALGATVSVGAAVESVQHAIRVSNVAGARLAQHGFKPIISAEEYSEAIAAAVVDVIFALVDVVTVTGAVIKATRTGAGQAGRALAGSLERSVVASWRRFDEWPAALVDRLRARARVHLSGLASLPREEAERLLEEAVKKLQSAMLARYERQLVQLQEDFERAIATGLTPEGLEQWLARNLTNAEGFLDDLARDERLLDEVLGPRRTRPAEGPLTAAAAEELAAFLQELGMLAEVLTPERLAWLRQMTGRRYVPLARQLAKILAESKDVAAAKAALTRLERLLIDRHDILRILDALERSPAPLRVLDALTPELLDVHLVGGFDELFAAAIADSRTRVLRITSDIDRHGQRELLRELAGPGAGTSWERWVQSRQEWAEATDVVPAPRLAPPPARDAPLGLAQATRARTTREALADAPGGARLVSDLDAAGREGQEILAALGLLKDPLTPAQLAGVGHFLRNGGEPRVLSEILVRFSGRATRLHERIRKFLEALPSLGPSDVHGLHVVMASGRWDLPGVEWILRIAENFRGGGGVFGALADVADRAEGLDRLIAQLASADQATNQGALGQLLLGRKLLAGSNIRLAFEVPLEVEGVLIRRLDIQLLSPHTRTVLYEVESKEITSLASISSSKVRRQFAKDIARSTAAARAGEAPLERIKWFVREDAIAASFPPDEIRIRVRESLRRAFESDELAGLSATQRAAALQDFDENFARIVEFF